MYEYGSIALGDLDKVVNWRRVKPGQPLPRFPNYGPAISILCASTVDDGAYIPAQDVSIIGREKLLLLRQAIDEALREPAKGEM